MFDARKIPDELRDLIPLAKARGVNDEDTRDAKVASATPGERASLVKAVQPHSEAIEAWLNSFGEEDPNDEAATFMYLTFAAESARRMNESGS